ncbi:hypothetical protein ACFX2I_023644 [Malus domestica]
MMPLMWCSAPLSPPPEAVVGTLMAKKDGSFRSVVINMRGAGTNNGFPSFLPKEVEKIKDPYARTLAQRMERLPVPIASSESCIMSSCVRPRKQSEINPVVLLHCFDSSCLEWRCAYPLLEEAGLEAWVVDVLGWGFSDLGDGFVTMTGEDIGDQIYTGCGPTERRFTAEMKKRKRTDTTFRIDSHRRRQMLMHKTGGLGTT